MIIFNVPKKYRKKPFMVMFYKKEPTNYLISTDGTILSLNYQGRGKIKEMTQFNHDGYKAVNLSIKGELKRTLVHRLVAENYIRNPDPDRLKFVNHKNGIKTDNYVENLEWVTHAENIQHAVDHDLISYHTGEDHPNSIITKKQAKKICKLLEQNKLCIDAIAEETGTTRGVVYSIKYGYTWKEISKNYDVTNHNVAAKRSKRSKPTKITRKLVDADVVMICDELANGTKSIKEIAKMYGVGKSCIESIRYGHSWTHISSNYDFSNRNIYKPRKKYGKE